MIYFVKSSIQLLMYKKALSIGDKVNFQRKPLRVLSRRSKNYIERIITENFLSSRTPKTLVGKVKPIHLLVTKKVSESFPKGLFHIKCVFDLNELLAYDAFNFYRSTLPGKTPRNVSAIAWSPTKLNFFYRIRYSIQIFRAHTLRFFEISFRTEHRVNLFFKTLERFNAMTYMWFFEFNASIFLVKVGFTESMLHSIHLIGLGICSVSGELIRNRWQQIKPGAVIQMPLGLYHTQRLIFIMAHRLNFTKYYKSFMYRFFLRKKLPLKTGKRNNLILSIFNKYRSFKFIEFDVKTATAILLPYKDNMVYFRLIFIFWINYWNFRVVLWKYRT